MKKFAAALAICGLFLAATASAQLTAEFPVEGGNISLLSGDAIALSGIEFASGAGSLVPTGGNAAPFAFMLSDTANLVTYAQLPGAVNLAAGSTTVLAAGVSAGASDVTATFGALGDPVPVAFPVNPAGIIPEPASGLMAAFGIIGLLGFRRRR